MKKAYRVTFKWSDNVYCSNIAIGEENAILSHYGKKYTSVHIEPADDYDIEIANRKGMPIVRL